MECGGCTLCCLAITAHSVNKQAGEWCRYCEKSVGCSIHEIRPKECRQFFCAYCQMSKVSIDLRPDNCRIIFEKISDRIFFGTLPPGESLTEIARNQILVFLKESISVLVVESGKHIPTFYIAKSHTFQEIAQEYNEYLGDRLWQLHHIQPI